MFGIKKNLYEYFEKNQFQISMYSGINLIILLILLIDDNFFKIKEFLLKIIKVENENNIVKFIILIILALIIIYISRYKIISKSINNNLYHFSFIFLFQILALNKDQKIFIILELILLIIIMLLCRLFLMSEKKVVKNKFYKIIMGIEIVIAALILLSTIINQTDILKQISDYKNNKTFEWIYFSTKVVAITIIFIYCYYKIIPSAIERNILIKIYEIYEEKKNYLLFNYDKINQIKKVKTLVKKKKIFKFKFKDNDLKNEFIYLIKKEYQNKYSIYYKKEKYYMNYQHFELNIEIIKFKKYLKEMFFECLYRNYRDFCKTNSKYKMLLSQNLKLINKKLEIRKKILVIDRIIDNDNNFKSLKNEFDMLIVLSLEEDMVESRLDNLERLKKEIYLGEKSILIDDNWGNGKTFFIKKFMEIYNKDFEFIYIKVPYFDNKKEFRKKILTEIYRVFKKNKIITSSLKELMSYFNVNIQKFDLGFISFDFNKLLSDNSENDYSEILIDIKNNLAYLEKKIIIILDDFDRVENKSQIIEVLNFIGELNIELSETITLITLSSYEKLVKIIENEEVADKKLDVKKYLEKYFDKIFHLSSSNFCELVSFFSDIYNLNLKRVKILKEIREAISSQNKHLLVDNNITFRNIERLVKNLKRVDIEGIKQEFKDIYEKVFIFWEAVEYLIPESWNEFKVIEDIDIDEKTLVTPYSLYNIMLDELKWDWKLDGTINSEKKEIFIHSILEAVRKYKLSKYKEPLFHYLNIRNEILNLNSKYKLNISYKDYKEINNMFKFTIENRKVIFNFLMKDKNITQCELLNLMIAYRINYKWNYEDCENFFKDLERNRNEGEKISRNDICIFIGHLLLVNSFIDMQKIESLKFLEKKSLISLEEIYNFFKDFVIETKKDECYLFIDKIFNIAIDAKFYRGNNTSFDKKKNHMESLKKELVNAQYLINKDDKSIESIKCKIQTVKNKFDISDLDEIINFLKENHNELYEIWENYLQKIRK